MSQISTFYILFSLSNKGGMKQTYVSKHNFSRENKVTFWWLQMGKNEKENQWNKSIKDSFAIYVNTVSLYEKTNKCHNDPEKLPTIK